MIITRTAGTVDFQLSDTRRVVVDVAEVASAAMAIARRADGRLDMALELRLGRDLVAQRIEAGLDQLGVMYARIVEMMQEIRGPSAAPATHAPSGQGLDLPY